MSGTENQIGVNTNLQQQDLNNLVSPENNYPPVKGQSNIATLSVINHKKW